MLMKCKTCEKGFVPAKKIILNCNKCIIKKTKTNQKKTLKKHHQKANKIMTKKVIAKNKMR